jgi:rfaE bifunctional protein kinase chain/domain
MATTVDPRRLIAIVDTFPGRRVAVLGDLCTDEFVYGDIARVSREAPVLILERRRTVVVPGGAGNSVANLRALGARPLPVGVVGRDEPGRRLLAELKRLRVPTAGIASVDGYETPCKSRILAGGVHTRRQQIVRIDAGAPRGELPRPVLSRVRRALDTALRRVQGLLVADYGYGVASPAGLNRRLAGFARRGLPVTVDSRSRVGEFRGVTACSPNQEELEQALGLAGLADREIDDAGRRLLRSSGNQAVLVTRGAKGMSLFRRRSAPAHIAAYGSDEVADVTGAGDTVAAVFTLSLIAGGDLLDAAVLANIAAGLVVTKAGTATIDRGELCQAVEEALQS